MLTDVTRGDGGAGTLASTAETVDLAVERSAAFVLAVSKLAEEAVAAFGEPAFDPAGLQFLDSMMADLSEAFSIMKRYLTIQHWYGESWTSPSLGLEADVDFYAWRKEAKTFKKTLLTARCPLTEGGRQRRYDEYSKLMWAYCNDAASLRTAIIGRLFRKQAETVSTRISALLAARAPLLEDAYRGITQLPAAIRPDWRESDVVTPGPGRLRLCVGSAAFTPVTVTTLCPATRSVRTEDNLETAVDASERQTHTVQLAAAQVPLILDLDRDGGLKTDDPDVVASAALRLLALLPANRLQISVFDPLRLGESAAALFALDEIAPAVIGDKVWTSASELSDLLTRTEEHLTLVTQKYLQGQHSSLTAYNAQAGEVAEAYRLLILYDFPAGFSRADGRFDEEASARLGKIITMGPRCGVFTFIVSSELAKTAAAQQQQQQQQQQQPKRVLPSLYRGQNIEDDTFNQLLGVPAWGRAMDGILTNPTADADDALARATARQRHAFTVSASGGRWTYAPAPALTAQAVAGLTAHVQRAFASATDVQVTPRRVAELGQARVDRDAARGVRAHETLPLPGDPATWWHGRADRGAAAQFGRSGANDVAVLGLDSENQSNVLLGGRPGAGKSVWLHAVIASLCQRYSPEELSLYLVDFKEGVEFKAYAAGRLPHARVVAVESEREFGLSVLLSLDAEITRRGNLLRGTDGHQVEIGAYRARTGSPLPRIVLIVDEFHVLFERDDKIATAAGEIFERIVRQGRAFGIHTILASQTLAGTSGLGRHIFNLIPVRVALQSSDADSRMLLADDNAEAHLLTRPGEGILNTRAGLKEANQRFQTAYWSSEERAALVAGLRQLADARGFTQVPAVFEGKLPAPIAETPIELLRPAAGQHDLRLVLGLPLTLDPPVGAHLRREPGGNLLMVTPDEVSEGLLTVLLTTLAANAVECEVLDFGSPDAPWTRVLDARPQPGTLTRRRSRSAAVALAELAKQVDERQDAGEYQAPAKLVFLLALHRAREFDAAAYDNEQNALLERILRDGPDVGVHVVAWCDKALSLDRKLSPTALREFGVRLLTKVDRDTSFRLIDSDAGVNLPASQAVLDDHDRGEVTRLRWFTGADEAWIRSVLCRDADESA